jgi:hypothetical protein
MSVFEPSGSGVSPTFSMAPPHAYFMAYTLYFSGHLYGLSDLSSILCLSAGQ